MPVRTLVRGPLPQGFDGSTPPPADETPFQIDDDDGLLKWLDADGHVKTAGGAGGGLPDPWTVDADQLAGPQIKTDTALFGTATEAMRTGGIGDPYVLLAQAAQGTALVLVNETYGADKAQFKIQLENDGRVYLLADDEIYMSTQGEITIEGDESVDIFNDLNEITFTELGGVFQVYGSTSGVLNYITLTAGANAGDLVAAFLGTSAIMSGAVKGNLQTNANATTGLTAGVLAALTNASIVIKDGSGQAYRVPVIV